MLAGFALVLTGLTGCDGASSSVEGSAAASSNGSGSGDSSAVQGSTSPMAVGATCHSTNPDDICIGMKVVVFKDSRGNAVSDEATTLANLAGINKIWKQCGIAFQVEKYETVNPADMGLAFGGSSAEAETSATRKAYEDDNRFLVVTTGAWNVQKNAWTASPGAGPYGAVMEGSIASGYSEIYAHELGHYLNLDHTSQGATANVMSATIAHSSVQLNASQCTEARATAKSFWSAMLR